MILDRWTVVFHSDEASKQEFPSALTMTPGAGSGAEDNAAIFVMNNYLGIGLDADLCLGFHNAREENPDKFNSRLVGGLLFCSYLHLDPLILVSSNDIETNPTSFIFCSHTEI